MTSKYSRVSGYNPRFIVWWVEGCRTPKTVTFPTRRLATRVRQNLYALRVALRREEHHAIFLIERGEIIHRPVNPDHTGIDDPHTLTIRPANFDLNDILDEAGIGQPGTDAAGNSEIPITFPKAPHPFDYANTMKGVDDDKPDDE